MRLGIALLNTYNHHYTETHFIFTTCPCLDLGLFLSYLCDLFFIFSVVFIVINHITSLKQTYLFFVHFLEYLPFLDDITWMKKANNFHIAKV